MKNNPKLSFAQKKSIQRQSASLPASGKPFRIRSIGVSRKKCFSLPSRAGTREEGSQAIPKIIWQTNFPKKARSRFISITFLIACFPRGFEYRYVSTEERLKFFEQTRLAFMPDAAEIYQKLADGAAQADFWRIATLYLEGGVYMDIDATLVAPLSRILKKRIRGALYQEKKRRWHQLFSRDNSQKSRFQGNAIANSGKCPRSLGNGIRICHNRAFRSSKVLQSKDFSFLPRNAVCIQGVFTNSRANG